ncbi:MAG: hypothetical protein NC409_06255 [Clostridium sp.]|nr:hypothetical protein [Clostridium sp.]
MKKRMVTAAMAVVTALCMGMIGMTAPMQVSAAGESQTVVVETTQRCSIWSAPATTEENRVKYVDEGYQITLYPEVIQSGLGDGKTFYRTIKGAYVLCRCVVGDLDSVDSSTATGTGTGSVTGSADSGAAAGTGSAALPVGSMDDYRALIKALLPQISYARVETEVYDYGDGSYNIEERYYDASGENIRTICYVNEIVRIWCYVGDGGRHITYYDAQGNITDVPEELY